MNLNNLFKSATSRGLLKNIHPILAVLTFIAITMVSIALLPFLVLFLAISFISFSLFGRKIMTKATAKFQNTQQNPYREHPHVEREHSFQRSQSFNQEKRFNQRQSQGRTFEHQGD